jgi:hypothetical protein
MRDALVVTHYVSRITSQGGSSVTLVEFLRWCAGPGVAAVVGFLMAFALEISPGFEKWAPRQKRLLTMALSFVVPLAATVGLYGLMATTDQIWAALQSGFLAFFGSQAGHALLLPAVQRLPVAPATWRKSRVPIR